MGYYVCPKCGGKDTYRGTELVSGSKGGGAIIGPENELGFSPVVGVGGRTTTSEQTVVKCKTCNIILGEKDRHLTPDETEQRAKDFEADRWKKKITKIAIFTIGLLISVPVFLAAGTLVFLLPPLCLGCLLLWTIVRR